MAEVRKFGLFYSIGRAAVVYTIKNLTHMIASDMGEPSLFYTLFKGSFSVSGLHTA